MSKTKTNEAALEAAARSTGAALAQDAKVRIKIPVNKKDPADVVVPVAVNGYLYYINRGQSVEVPETVASILSEAGYI